MQFFEMNAKLLKDKRSFLKEKITLKISAHNYEKTSKKVLYGYNFTLYLHPQSGKGRLAQLVQSTWFTPKGSGVRIPCRPLFFKIASLYFRATSSAGSEHLVYTQGVRGSNPLSPT